MRLIDADQLIDGYRHMGYDPNEHPEESYMEGWYKGFNAGVDHCIGHVIHAPTIEPERKTGKWIDKGWNGDRQYKTDGRGNCWHEWQCSECNHITKGAKWHFCPNCGAKMEEGENNV